MNSGLGLRPLILGKSLGLGLGLVMICASSASMAQSLIAQPSLPATAPNTAAQSAPIEARHSLAPRPQTETAPRAKTQPSLKGLSEGQDLSVLEMPQNQGFRTEGLAEGQSLSFAGLDISSALTPQSISQSSPESEAPKALDPAVVERIKLARQLMAIDGTEEIIRHYVNTVHMKLIIAEVNKYVVINNLSESERYRMAAIANSAAIELGDKILNLNARVQASQLSRDELMLLIHDFDIDAQKKLTRMRLMDNGDLDKQAALEMQLAQLQIIKAFENP